MSELVECVPNFSEGRNLSVVRAMLPKFRAIVGPAFGQEMNADHNRCVITFVGEAEAVVEAGAQGAQEGDRADRSAPASR